MKKNYFLKITTLFTFMLCSVLAYSQVNLYTQDFEGTDFDTYQLYNAGGTAVAFATTGTDYIVRANPSSLPLGNTVSGISGNAIALEDIDGAGFFGQHRIDTSPINIAGAVDMSVQVRIAAPRGADGNRYEAADFLRVQVSIDGGAFSTIISTGGATNGSGIFYYDTNNDGTLGNAGDQVIDQSAGDQLINVSFPGAGTSLVVRFLFSSEGSQEEMIFDDISVDAVSSTLSTENFTLDNAFTVTPNPSNGLITIGNSGIALDKVQVSDLNGRVVATYNLNGMTESKTLNLSSVLSSGMYLMTLTSNEASTVKKLIIK
ncbi:T9SS type A sorting domain-containing protein [Pontimicrobium sp. MEBiC01747]